MPACSNHKKQPAWGYSPCAGCEIEYLRSQVKRLEKDLEEEISSRDRWEDRATILARVIADYFDTDIGEWSNVNDPVENALLLLLGKDKKP